MCSPRSKSFQTAEIVMRNRKQMDKSGQRWTEATFSNSKWYYAWCAEFHTGVVIYQNKLKIYKVDLHG